MSTPIVAIIGRPNVGKSTLFNRLLQRRQAIVDEQEGITRDRVYGEVEWVGHTFTLVDTGGYIPKDADMMDVAVRRQVELAIEEADFLLLLVDARDGVTPADKVLAEQVRRSQKDHLLVINKVDNIEQEILQSDFYSLGFDSMMTISALEGRKTGDLLDRVLGALGAAAKKEKNHQEEGTRVAIIGMPNVGKSSIANALLGQEKCIVTEIPGTTRDSIDSEMKFYGRTFVLVDTAGLRRKAKITEAIEFYSSLRAYKAIQSAHIVLVIIDAVKGFGNQDQQIVRRVIDKGKGLVLVVNKWDLVVKETNTQEEYKKAMQRLFKSLENYPILFVSAKTKKRIFKLLPECQNVFDRWSRKIPTNALNRSLERAVQKHHPPAVRGKKIRIKYVTQVSQSPPRLVFFSNFPELIPESYRNYLENQIREQFDLMGVPIRLTFRKS